MISFNHSEFGYLGPGQAAEAVLDGSYQPPSSVNPIHYPIYQASPTTDWNLAPGHQTHLNTKLLPNILAEGLGKDILPSRGTQFFHPKKQEHKMTPLQTSNAPWHKFRYYLDIPQKDGGNALMSCYWRKRDYTK